MKTTTKYSFSGLFDIENVIVFIIDFDGTLAKLNVRWNNLKKDLESFIEDSRGEHVSFSILNSGLIEARYKYGKSYLLNYLYPIIAEYEQENLDLVIPNHKLINFIKSTDKKYAVYSDNLTSTIRLVVKQLNVEYKIDIIFGKDSFNNYKPHSNGVEKIVKFYKVDNLNDIV